MAAQTYTHRDLARLLGVSETTVKSYRSKFPAFLPVAREGKPVRLHPESLEVCRRIRDLFADGLSILQATVLLRSEFKEYPSNRRLSTSQKNAPCGTPDPGLDQRLEALAQAQELARQRMEMLEAEVRNLATLEASSKALVAELLQEFRAARTCPQPKPTPPEPARPVPAAEPGAPAGPTVLTARKIVTVHGRTGQAASYALDREPRPEAPFAAPVRPEAAFLDLPAVILSDRGEFLGLPGGQSAGRLVELLEAQADAAAAWFAEGADAATAATGDAWSCEVVLGPALARELLFERTTTPRGNLVALIRCLRTRSGTAEAESTQQELQEFFRQVRDQLA